MTTLSENPTVAHEQTPGKLAKPSKYWRFSRWDRIEHALLLSSFTVLVITGVPQKFAGYVWADWMITVMGGIETVRVIHRIAAIVLMLSLIHI